VYVRSIKDIGKSISYYILGLGGIAILVLNILYRKNHNITIYTKAFGLTVLFGYFDLTDLVLQVPGFCPQ